MNQIFNGSDIARALKENVLEKLPQQKNYYGGSYGGNGSKWPGGLSSTYGTISLDHWKLRQQSRKAFHQTPQARALIQRMVDSVVDSGLKLDSTPNAKILGITQEKAEEWAQDVEERYDLWASSKDAHRSEINTFYQFQRLYALGYYRDGEAFTRVFYNRDRSLISPVQVEAIDPNQIKGDITTSTLGNVYQNDGIERDAKGRESSYSIRIPDPENPGQFKFIKIPAKGVKSKKPLMLHGFSQEYAGQSRGISKISHAIQDFENITDFETAQVKKAINQSNFVGYVLPSKVNPASDPTMGMGFGVKKSIAGSNLPASPSNNSLLGDFCQPDEVALNTPGSTLITMLNEGEDLKAFPNTAPSPQYAEFVDALVSYLSASMSLPIEVLKMEFKQNYSASRGALMLFWRVVKIHVEEMGSDLLNPTYVAWLSEEIAAGRIKAPGWQDKFLRMAWSKARWLGPPMPNIDPQKTAKADEKYLRLGGTTPIKIARDYNGSDARKNIAVNKKMFPDMPILVLEENQNQANQSTEVNNG